ncbi:hypothetical protein [Streptomyces sp. NPDC096142]|uniref:hypothetical protein n=1 Tax=Streptomyces sp. NPDC096142 TaxID=3366077 RepID=UPI00381E5C81
MARVCRHCDVVIADPDDAVHMWREESMSGPGRDVWAHREHVDLVEPDTVVTRILARVLVAKALHPTETGGGLPHEVRERYPDCVGDADQGVQQGR